MERKTLMYRECLCIPRRLVLKLLELAHDSKFSGHLRLTNYLRRLEGYPWKQQLKDVKNYEGDCVECQQKKDHLARKFSEPPSIEVPTARWEAIATDFRVNLHQNIGCFETITIYVDLLSRRARVLESMTSDTAVDCTNVFFLNYFTQCAPT